MPPQARLDASGTLHHVIIRGAEREFLFREDKDRQNFLSRLAQICQDTKARILAWVLMSNHVHLLMSSGHRGVSKFMRRLLTGYAVWYNRKYHRSGHLFQNRYKSIVCEGFVPQQWLKLFRVSNPAGKKWKGSTTSPSLHLKRDGEGS